MNNGANWPILKKIILLTRLDQQSPDYQSILKSMGADEKSLALDEIIEHIKLHFVQSCFDEAKQLIAIGRDLADKNAEDHYKIDRCEVSYWEKQGKLEKAFALLEDLYKKWCHSRSCRQRGAAIIMDMGIMAQSMNQLTTSLNLFRKANQRYKKLGMTYNVAASLFNMASIEYDLKHYNKSQYYCQEALQSGAQQYIDIYTNISLQMANNFEAINDSTNARRLYETALYGYQLQGDYKQFSNIDYRIGWILLNCEQFQQAERPLKGALNKRMDLDYASSLLRYHFYRAETMRHLKMRREALRHYLYSVVLADKTKEADMATKARFGVYRLLGLKKHFLSHFIRIEVDSSLSGGLLKHGQGAYYRMGGDGDSLKPYPERHFSKISAKESESLSNLLNDLSVCMSEAKPRESRFYRAQQKAILGYSNN